jgi:murein DD-endopeptidase MepM/ murein hydrolase activator NlpD
MKTPVNNAIITSPFGYRKDPITGALNSFHDGIDFISKSGDKSILAIADGVVTYIFNKYNPLERWDLSKESAAGNYLIYSIAFQGKQYFIKPLHFQKIGNLKAGDNITEGENLGEYGDVGYSAGAHTHIYCYNSLWQILDPTFLFEKLL